MPSAPSRPAESAAAEVVHIVGARPNFVKAAPVVAALRERGVRQAVVHTGQHYDDRMSAVFFRELGLPRPDVDLGVGSGSHAEQTAALLVGLEREFIARSPGFVIVYGDVNSTLAAALVAAKLHIPVAHVEAGLRSFDPTMPEEVNRRVTDQLSDLCFATSPEAVGHLANEGVDVERVHFVGNPMIDTLLANLDRFDVAALRSRLDLPETYLTATLHRPANVDDPATVARLVARLHEVADDVDVVMPVHPRGRAAFDAAGLGAHERVRLLEPLGYIDFVTLVRGAAAVVTDSGGVQEETTILGVPCLTLRPNTERPVTITHGTNRLVVESELPSLVAKILAGDGIGGTSVSDVPPLWDGQAGPRIAAVLASELV
ncbi:non-hydrolyzing UDP-N-acetylglucosamine 2-epimerase [Marinitenerispora sediminis]|uniref:UDP-N-acetylglucosamine 2-epimerase (Non-hydrolyzing) n=1 Tax=Marinitenerispora sediminis TaxID=1931232 RepID=A0A368T8W4_9ACTN|nr:UDP-N-acetylglucosamine 2-epimerase (non-hydrolyzing) [Marinitenerispora sediminis]RCV54329.1 UDP-N-acetylglucosamine 2-epimerase (non-hydrolyzing) [Marinitenerispora sediminis]RCV60497.1 UDP-N-acetylglucosamine 2-epimerase (non-hydrolyzing) [Marinitenerispora sediminis]RCV61049.1 UDP-N-acetylglucosamine 2-epimerase (non-hydrolyzing) [Marinitenerispora sediminis]